MSTIITHEATTLTPAAVTDYNVQQQAGTIIHPILGRSNPDVTYRPAGLRTGTLTLQFDTEADADEARTVHANATGSPFALLSTERPTISMLYVLGSDGIGATLQREGYWTVTVGFQEVTA